MKQVSIATQVEKRSIVPPERPPLWMIREDRAIFGYIRSCAPCPAVIVLKDDPHAIFTKSWQFFYRAVNYNVPLRYISPNYGSKLAFFNGTGFPGRHNWITGDDADQKDPNADKVRSCVRNVVTGEPVYSLLQAIRKTISVVRTNGLRRLSLIHALTARNMLKVTTFDSRQPPPLKPGRVQPETVEAIDVDDYEITPRTHRWMFVAENIVNAAGFVKPFDHGATYPWTGTNDYFTFLPLISNHGYGDVLYPLDFLMPIASYQEIPSPYRFA